MTSPRKGPLTVFPCGGKSLRRETKVEKLTFLIHWSSRQCRDGLCASVSWLQSRPRWGERGGGQPGPESCRRNGVEVFFLCGVSSSHENLFQVEWDKCFDRFKCGPPLPRVDPGNAGKEAGLWAQQRGPWPRSNSSWTWRGTRSVVLATAGWVQFPIAKGGVA